MEITIKLFATLRKNRFEQKIFTYPGGTTLNEIVADLNIPEKDITIIMVNNIHSDLNHAPEDGDVIALFPAVGGG